MVGAPFEVPGPVDTLDDGPLSVEKSEDVEAVVEEEKTELVTSPSDELEGSSLPPLVAELVGELAMVLFDAELGGSVIETLELSLLGGLDAPGEE